MPNNEKDYGFGRTTVESNDGWYPTKQKPTTSNLYPYNHIDDLINEKLEQHLKRTDNPHQVTLQQLGVDHLFTHNIRVEYDEVKPELHLILLDLNGNDLKDVGPIDIDLSKYSDEQLEAVKEELKEYIEGQVTIINEQLEELTAKTDTLEGEITDLRTYVDDVITETITLLENEIREIQNEIERIISELSIEELSKRDYYDPDYQPEYELATEFDPEKQYYEQVYNVDDSRIEGMWQLPDELNYVGGQWDYMPWINDINGYYYNENGNKVNFVRFGRVTKGTATGDPGQEDTSKVLGIGVGYIWSGYYFPMTAYYSYGTEYFDDNYLNNRKGYFKSNGTPSNAMKLLYFNSSSKSEEFANSWKYVGAVKVSDTLLDYGDTNYDVTYNPISLTPQTFEPNKYYVRKEVIVSKVTRIELGEDSSTYRDSLGNDVLKIVKNNVLLNGDILAPDLQVVNNSQNTLILENNAEKTFSNKVTNLNMQIPNNIKHGFTSYVVFETGNGVLNITVTNNSSYNFRMIKAGSVVSQLEFDNGNQYNLLFLCNGVNIELYIQEIMME